MRQFVTVTLLFASLLLLPSCRRKTATPSSASSKPVSERAGTDPARAEDEAALREAAIKGDIGTVKVLLDEGVNVNAKDADGRTALTEAAFYGRTEIAKMLLDKGADVFAKKNDGATLLTIASSHKEIAEMIQQEIQLLEVAGKGDNAMVKELLDKGAYVDVRDPEGRTPLTEAMWLVPAVVDEFDENAPLATTTSADDVANLVAFLASDESSSISGTLQLIDRGAHNGEVNRQFQRRHQSGGRQ